MVTEAAVKMASVSFEEGFEKDIDMLLREQQNHSHLHHEQSRAAYDRERDLNVYRSGSAPPTVEGSRNAIGSLFGRSEVAWLDGQNFTDELSEEKMRSQLSYTSYYYSNENLNPRLPPPIMSKEDWRVVQRFRFGGSGLGGGDPRSRLQSVESDESSRSLFSMQPSLSVQDDNETMEYGGEWLERGRDGLIGFPEIGLGSRRKSFADVLQEDLNNSSSKIMGNSRPPSRNTFDHAPGHMTQLRNDIVTLDGIRSGRTSPALSRVQSMGSKASQSFSSAVDPSLPRCRTTEPLMIGRSSSPGLPAIGSRAFDIDSKKSMPTPDYADVAAALAGLNLSSKAGVGGNTVQKQFQHESDCYNASINGFLGNDFSYARASNEQINFQKCLSDNLYKKSDFGRNSSFAGSSGYCNLDSLNANFSESNSHTYLHSRGLPSALTNHLDPASATANGTEYMDMLTGQEGSGYPTSAIDPLYAQYLQASSGSTSPYPGNLTDSSLSGNFVGSSLMDLTSYQKAYLEALLAQQKVQFGGSLSKAGSLSNGIYGASSLGLGLGMAYPSSPLSPGLNSPLSHGGLRQNDRLPRLQSMLWSGMGVPKGSWSYENGIMEESFASTLLEDFKNNKTRSFELTDILDNVVEFSADQYGSRFIQQKLESASVDEKNKIFPEILPHARSLMTDVFGNYVIQKFFEHGTDSQRNELAGQVIGHVLPLSLQMYGCRVIQKALEVVGMDQQALMVSELDGSIMKCVRDQNGNHVIQKCIECVPQERIHFIISAFYGQVVSLSTHPYGCRVIQRVLEHCNDLQTQIIMMDEILLSVCSLAEDQYGNYVVQHVLQHGKPTERSAIITKLSGQIVKMSQQKFASNVIEKCLTYGRPEERLLLIKEMLGPNEENEPLQAMMKDQFGNYVVQKVLETCDDQNRELILSRIKVHLSALKKYTYGKHIVARVEKLIAAGERRMGMGMALRT